MCLSVFRCSVKNVDCCRRDSGIVGSSIKPESDNNTGDERCLVGGCQSEEETVAVDQLGRLAEETTDAHFQLYQ